MRDHTKLRAFELADRLVIEVYESTQSFPRSEQFGVTSQMQRAAVSIACNIVEGCARKSEGEFLRFLDIFYGSARELEYLVSVASRLGYVHESRLCDLFNHCNETSKVIYGLIRSLG